MKKLILLFLILSFKHTLLMAAEKSAGEILFEARCGSSCHQLPEPSMLTVKQWQLVLITMQKRMEQAKVPPLTHAEKALLLSYLAQYARK